MVLEAPSDVLHFDGNRLVMAIVSLLVYAALAAALFRLGRPWANPAFLILVYYFFNYPVRAILLTAFPDAFNVQAFTADEVTNALEYSTLYVALFIGTYLLLLQGFGIRFDFQGVREEPADSRIFAVATALVLVSGLITIGYEISVGGTFSIATEVQALQRPFWVNVCALPYALKWFALCMGAFLWIRSRSRAVVTATVLLAALCAAEAVVTTGKGIVLAFLLLFLFVDNLATGRVLRLGVVLVGGIVGVLFSAYSYTARLQGSLGFGSVEEHYEFIAETAASSFDEIVLENIIDRGTYYLDALVLIARSDAAAEAGPYAYGSLVELANLVPRATGLISEQYSFDRYVTWAVWGDSTFAQVFVGRIGESFFVLGYAGLIYALLYALIFAGVAALWRRMTQSIAGISLYFAVLQGWLYQDASLLFQLKNLIGIVLCYLAIRWVAGMFATRPRSGSPAVQNG
jgi:hypothetical protein